MVLAEQHKVSQAKCLIVQTHQMCHVKEMATFLTPKDCNTMKVSQLHIWVRRLNYEMNMYGCGVYIIAQFIIQF